MKNKSSDDASPTKTVRLASVNGTIVAYTCQCESLAIVSLSAQLEFICKNAPHDRRTIANHAASLATVPAKSIEELSSKAAALRTLYFGEEYFEPLDFGTPLGRLFVSLLNDLSRLRAPLAD